MIFGVVKLTHLKCLPGSAGEERPLACPLCGHGRPGNLPSGLESLRRPLSVLRGREEVPPRSYVRWKGAIGHKTPLGVAWRFNPLHPPFPLPR
jgi:hypothetical protein